MILMGLLVTLPEMVAAQNSDDAMISIGLLVNEMNEKKALEAARKIVRRINESGGVRGKELNLESRLVKGAWGAGSSQIVDLVFKDKVIGIVGALDGRNTHLAEQVIAKTQVVYVSAWASDPTLSKAYVSWYFSVVPTDDQQARLLATSIDKDHKNSSRVLVIHDGSYDANQAFKSFRSAITESQNVSIHTLEILPSKKESVWLPKITAIEMDVVVVFGTTLPIFKINETLQRNYKVAPPLYFNLAASASTEFEKLKSLEPNTIRYITNTLAKDSKSYGSVEDYVADGLMALITSLQNTETDFSNMRKVMSEINFQGVTGQIEFDGLGRLKNAENQLQINPSY